MAKWYKPKTLWGIMLLWIALPLTIILLAASGVFQTALSGYDFTHYPVKDGELTEQELEFGESPFLVSPPKYSEDCNQEGKYFAPSPAAECWSAEAYFQGETYILTYDEDVEINDWLTVKWTTDGLVDNGESEDFDRTDTLKVRFDSDVAFQFDASIPAQSVFGEEAEIMLDVTNTMATAEVVVEIKEERGLFNVFDTLAGEQAFSSQTHTINQGVSEIVLPISQETLGENTYTISLIPQILYSEGTYQENTDGQTVSTTTLAEAAFSEEFAEELEESETTGTSILTGDGITTETTSSLLDSIAGATKGLYVVLTIFGAVAIYLLYLIILRGMK